MKNLIFLTILALPLFGMGQDTIRIEPFKADTLFMDKGIKWMDYIPGDTIRLDTAQLLKDGWKLPTFKLCYFSINGKCYQLTDTIPVIVGIQYTNRDATILREAYLINGEPWYRSPAPLTRGKWIKIRCVRWKVENNWITNKK